MSGPRAIAYEATSVSGCSLILASRTDEVVEEVVPHAILALEQDALPRNETWNVKPAQGIWAP